MCMTIPCAPALGKLKIILTGIPDTLFCRSAKPSMRELPQTIHTGIATQTSLCQPDMLSHWEPSPIKALIDSTCLSMTLCSVGTAVPLLTGLLARKSAGGAGRYRPGLLACPALIYPLIPCFAHLYLTNNCPAAIALLLLAMPVPVHCRAMRQQERGSVS